MSSYLTIYKKVENPCLIPQGMEERICTLWASTNAAFLDDASYEPLEVFVISIWFVQSFVKFYVIVGRQLQPIYIL